MLHPVIKKYLDSGKGDFLVTGPPGTGKTRIMLDLIEYFIRKNDYNTSRIVVFCFNRRWAKILREKTAESAGRSICEIRITTFFSFCAELIERKRFVEFISGNFTGKIDKLKILTAPQQWKLLKDLLLEDNVKKDYPAAYKYMNTNKFVARSFIQEVFDFILRAQENLIEPDALAAGLYPFAGELLSEITGIFRKYKKELVKRDIYDYGRLLEDSVSILKTSKNLKQFYDHAFDILVADEFQETNKAQYEIVKNLKVKNRIFFGNDDECTYAFRGSMLNNFNEVFYRLQKQHLNRKTSVGNILFLKKNYRSAHAINKVSEGFISRNKERILKTAKSISSEGPLNESLTLKEFKNTLEEINYICDIIKKHILIKNIKPEKICIIVKGSDYKSNLLTKLLTDNRIDYLMRSSRSLLDNPHVKYILDFMRLIDLLGKRSNAAGNPVENNIEKLFQSILFSSFSGLDPINVEMFFKENIDEEKLLKGQDNISICKAGTLAEVFKPADNQGLQVFAGAIDRYLKLADLNILEFLSCLVHDSEIGVIKNIFNDSHSDERKKENAAIILGDFIRTVEDFSESNPGSNSIGDYLQYLEDAIDNSFLEEIEQSTKDFIKPGYINILSYHQCKGLEFDCVFMPFINEDYLPSKFGMTQLYDMQLFSYFLDKKILREELLKHRHMENERRLLYNGMTRAVKYLTVTSSKATAKSLFFQELQDIYSSFLKKTKRKKQGFAAKKLINLTAHGSFSETAHGSFSESLDTMSVKNRWLERKKALAKHIRLISSGNSSVSRLLKELAYLKIIYPPDKWWSNVKATLNESNPFKTSDRSFSYSAISNYIECPFKYKINYFYNIRDDSGLALVIGNAYHEILKNFFKDETGKPSREKLNQIIINTFENLEHNDLEFSYLKDQLLQKALSDFNRYYGRLENIVEDSIRVCVERPFSFNAGENKITGRIDLMVFRRDGKIELIDFKSGSRNYHILDEENEMQLRIYRAAADLCSDFEEIRRKEFLLKYVFLGDEKKQENELPEDFYDPDDILARLDEVISNIKKESFEPLPPESYACRDCQMKIMCRNAGTEARDR